MDALLIVVGTAAGATVALSIGLLYLLARQVLPLRRLSTSLVVVAGVLTFNPVGLLLGVLAACWLQWRGLRRRSQRATHRGDVAMPALAQQWRVEVARARHARDRYLATVAQVPAGPLRARLDDLGGEAAALVAEAVRTAAAADQAERARRQVLSALRGHRFQRGDVELTASTA
ncbi:MAG: hypothetical protein H0V19_05630, partial [Euzebyales bacterium]|nr:hypothetical protein [Euzebyales bacterium]